METRSSGTGVSGFKGGMGMWRPVTVFCFFALSGGVQAQDAAPTVYMNPDWSPDGTRIAFEGGRDMDMAIRTIGIDGTGQTTLTDHRYNDEFPVWSPDGSKIAFISNRREGRDELPFSVQIYVMNADGSDQKRLTVEGSAVDWKPAWAPDGTRIAFQSRPESNPLVHSLFVVNADGTGRRRLTDGQYDDTDPQWSPDGKQILFVRSTALYKFAQDRTPEERAAVFQSADIALLDVESGEVTAVTQDGVRDFDPSWSPAGDAIYYFRDDGTNRTFMRQRLGGRPEVVVARGHDVSSEGPVPRTRVSPDGSTLVYHKRLEGGLFAIYLYDLSTGVERTLIAPRSAG